MSSFRSAIEHSATGRVAVAWAPTSIPISVPVAVALAFVGGWVALSVSFSGHWAVLDL